MNSPLDLRSLPSRPGGPALCGCSGTSASVTKRFGKGLRRREPVRSPVSARLRSPKGLS